METNGDLLNEPASVVTNPAGYESSLSRAAVESADQAHGTEVFEKLRVDVVVIEAITYQTNPYSSALTTVDLDHPAFLGNTVQLIAKEKASIARKNKPFVLGIQKYTAVENVVRSVVEQTGAHSAQRRAWDDAIDGSLPPTFSLDAESLRPLRLLNLLHSPVQFSQAA
ncbi:hypothetical protein CY34DRAFT_762363 [Suillus luteus UH-Slu-Lm8-n1]|uniref:Uncharacterized protein n=1 Tax=Suillus luteus UH-Slu-Lm8-n1 TaxID=930992 RepID=A0A0D0AIR2_9AGAM|nr:hypothetical protein CY34DRAFT_762363 [Suillus luteus UH-Slu-Lm8-n1]